MARIGIVNPNPPHLRGGNRTTALRWAGIFRRLHHRVFIEEEWRGRRCDLLVSLNAWKSADSIRRFHGAHPTTPQVVILTGTDLYTDLPAGTLRPSFQRATRLVVLQELALSALPEQERHKAVLIHQSVHPLAVRPPQRADVFEVLVVGNLRAVKDPLLAARAARHLPSSSRICVQLVGQATEREWEEAVREEQSTNPRFLWSGPTSRRASLEHIARARILASTSRAEGGAGVVSEALAHGTPVLATDIPGSRGMLSDGYPGFFPVGDAERLAQLMLRAERDAGFLEELRSQCASRAWITDPDRETAAWESLLSELGV